MIPVSFTVDQTSFSLEFDPVITVQQYKTYFTKVTGAGFEELIFLSGVNQLNVSVPLLTKLSSGSEVRIGRALTQSVVWDNHDCDILFTMESEGNASIMVLNNNSVDIRDRMIIDTAASKLVLVSTSEGTTLWIRNGSIGFDLFQYV
ncbi:hypothetical protein WA171_001937 [Blastocystis sp. BT1]